MTTQAEATMLLAAVAEFDTRFENLTPAEANARAKAWAATLADHRLSPQWLIEGVKRAYSLPERPLNPLGAIITEAKNARRIASKGYALRELTSNTTPPTREPLRAVYEQQDALSIPCPECHAPENTWCTNPLTEKPRIIPCISRRGINAHSTTR